MAERHTNFKRLRVERGGVLFMRVMRPLPTEIVI